MSDIRVSRLDDRYGRAGARRRGRIWAIVGGALLLAAVVAWSIWTGAGGATSSMEVATTAFRIHGDRSVSVDWTVNGRAATRLVCAIEAEDASAVVVGLQEVVVPGGAATIRTGTTEVRTTRAAVTGLIDSCRDA